MRAFRLPQREKGSCSQPARCVQHKEGQRKIIHCLRTDSGFEFSDLSEIRRFAVGFYKNLFKSEWLDNPDVHSSFDAGLPQVGSKANSELGADLNLQELYTAMMSLQSGKAPGSTCWLLSGPL